MERPPGLPLNVTQKQWDKIEADFRAWSFRVYYKRTFKNEHEPIVRFLKALKASTQPIRDRQAVLDWYQQRKRKREKKCPPHEHHRT